MNQQEKIQKFKENIEDVMIYYSTIFLKKLEKSILVEEEKIIDWKQDGF